MPTRCMNRVQLLGNITRDIELRYTPAGMAVASFGLATNRVWTTKQGEKKEDVAYHRIVAWNKLAELCAQLLKKGSRILVEGRLQYREITDVNGVKKQIAEVVIDDMIMLNNRNSAGGTHAASESVDYAEPPAVDTATSDDASALENIVISDEDMGSTGTSAPASDSEMPF